MMNKALGQATEHRADKKKDTMDYFTTHSYSLTC